MAFFLLILTILEKRMYKLGHNVEDEIINVYGSLISISHKIVKSFAVKQTSYLMERDLSGLEHVKATILTF